MDPDSEDSDSPRPASLWLLLVIAAALAWVGLDPCREDPEVALPAFGFAAFLVALFFLPGLREFVSRWPGRH